MKKTLTFLSLMGAMATSAVAGTVIVAPAPAPAPAPTVWASAVSVDALAAIADDSDNPNLWGPRFTYSLYTPATDTLTHEVNAGLALLWGSDDDVDLFELPITVGYNLNYAVTEQITAYVGGKMGMTIAHAEVGPDDDYDLAFRLAIGTGVKYAISPSMNLKLGYEFSSDYCSFWGEDVDLDYHTINLGVEIKF